MPELPEVETIIRDLDKKIINRSIKSVKVNLPRLALPSPLIIKKSLVNNKFKSITRRGKLIILNLVKGGNILLIHLKMTGQLIYCCLDEIVAGGHSLPPVKKCAENKYTRIILEFNNGARLYFNDMRTFGYWRILPKEKLVDIVSLFGVEPLSSYLNSEWLMGVLKNKKTSIKAVLLDQKIIAGIGNIYADEILYLAGIDPRRIANKIKKEEVIKLCQNIKRTLKKAVKYRGTTFNNYVDSNGRRGKFGRKLQVYQKQGQLCTICHSKIKKIKVAGRGTHYCAVCQR